MALSNNMYLLKQICCKEHYTAVAIYVKLIFNHLVAEQIPSPEGNTSCDAFIQLMATNHLMLVHVFDGPSYLMFPQILFTFLGSLCPYIFANILSKATITISV